MKVRILLMIDIPAVIVQATKYAITSFRLKPSKRLIESARSRIYRLNFLDFYVNLIGKSNKQQSILCRIVVIIQYEYLLTHKIPLMDLRANTL